MMNLNENAFSYKLYMACWLITKKLQGKERDDLNRRYVDNDGNPVIGGLLNLCPMMRTIFVWTPLYFSLIAILIASYSYVLFYLPYTFGGIVGYANTYVIPSIIAGIIVGCIFGFPILSRYLDSKAADYADTYDNYLERARAKKLAKEKRIAEGKCTVLELIWKYIVSTKQKMCPIINVIKKDEQP